VIERALAEYVVNALWQLPVLAAGAWLFIRLARPSPGMQHGIWLAVLALAVLLPGRGLRTAEPVQATAMVTQESPVIGGEPVSVFPRTRDVTPERKRIVLAGENLPRYRGAGAASYCAGLACRAQPGGIFAGDVSAPGRVGRLEQPVPSQVAATTRVRRSIEPHGRGCGNSCCFVARGLCPVYGGSSASSLMPRTGPREAAGLPDEPGLSGRSFSAGLAPGV
jgi:hypothetical protein